MVSLFNSYLIGSPEIKASTADKVVDINFYIYLRIVSQHEESMSFWSRVVKLPHSLHEPMDTSLERQRQSLQLRDH